MSNPRPGRFSTVKQPDPRRSSAVNANDPDIKSDSAPPPSESPPAAGLTLDNPVCVYCEKRIGQFKIDPFLRRTVHYPLCPAGMERAGASGIRFGWHRDAPATPAPDPLADDSVIDG